MAAAATRENHFDLIRMLAATGVLASHAWPIALGPGAVQPLERLTGGLTLGHLSVCVFFAVSGYFVTESLARAETVERFVRARLLRLFPALLAALLLTVAVAGLLSAAPAAVYWPAAAEYVAQNAGLFSLRFELPGVFEANPYGPAINGSLWTLSYEVLCYGALLVAGLAGFLGRPGLVAAGLAALFLARVAAPELALHPRLESLLDLGLPFAVGVAARVWRGRRALSWRLAGALWLAALAARLAPMAGLDAALIAVALGYTVLVAGFARAPWLLGHNRVGDYSYGLYIYAFPVQQCAAAAGVVTPMANALVGLAGALPLAILSWHLVERPALALKSARLPRRAAA